MKKWYESKTIWFNGLVTIIGIVSALQSLEEFQAYAFIFTPILIIGNTVLRVWFTNSDIASSGKVQ